MKRIKTTLVLVGGVALALAATYNILLSDQAKESLRNSARAVRDACDKVCDVVNESYGVVMDDNLPNREKTERQWSNLGY